VRGPRQDTSKDTDQPSASSLRNTLRTKLAQLPKTEPALLYTNLPDAWVSQGAAVEASRFVAAIAGVPQQPKWE
jgi:hypothetical protein